MENRKIYARQVPPEYQESPLQMCSEWPENVYAFGNRQFIERTEGLQEIRNALENIADEWEAMQAGHPYTKNLHAILWYELPRKSGEGYTRPERLELVRLAEEYTRCHSRSIQKIRVVLRVLELVRCEKYEHATIRGCCQGDWQEIIYPASYGNNFRNDFETEYFNTGTEWIIHDDDTEPEEPGDIDGYAIYCYTYDPRAEIAEYTGTAPENVTLYEFDGYTRLGKWRAV